MAVDSRILIVDDDEYGSDEVEGEARRLEIHEYITKRCQVSEAIEAARDALADVAAGEGNAGSLG